MQVIRFNSPDFQKYWGTLWEADYIQHPYYLPRTMEWFIEFAPNGKLIENLSFILEEDGVAVLGLMIFLHKNVKDQYTFCCADKPVLYLENKNLESFWKHEKNKTFLAQKKAFQIFH